MGITFYTGLKLGENKQSDITNTELITSGFSLRSRKERNKLRALAQKSPKSESITFGFSRGKEKTNNRRRALAQKVITTNQLPPLQPGEKKKPTIDEGL
ncbi:MAG: hypothetical protein RBR28_12750 [Lentimicrobium sp.]|jgi:hypothetical protein|nr:hypothetical protein [Lentimicrobium sp.]